MRRGRRLAHRDDGPRTPSPITRSPFRPGTADVPAPCRALEPTRTASVNAPRPDTRTRRPPDGPHGASAEAHTGEGCLWLASAGGHAPRMTSEHRAPSTPEVSEWGPAAPRGGIDGVRVFVSHAGPDTEWATWVAWQLHDAGYVVELDSWHWSAGDNFVARMSAALEQANVIVALWSSSYFESSRWTADEWTAVLAHRRPGAEGADKRLVPLRIEDVAPPGILRSLVARDLFGLNDEQQIRSVVLQAVAGSRAPAGSPPLPTRDPMSLGAAASTPSCSELPRAITDFTGREALVGQLEASLTNSDGVPVVSINGPGGVGKTALAVHVGHNLADRFPDGQLYVDLRGAEALRMDPSAVLADFLGQLGVSGTGIPTALNDRARLFRSRLAGRRVLVVLDNAATEAQIRPLLPGSAGCAVLITSRARLSALEGATTVDLEVLETSEAITLLTRIAGSERVQSDEAAARELVQLCGHLPLAVRIAGARLQDKQHWSVARFVERLRDGRRRLSELHAREDDVRAVFALGYQGRGSEEQKMFRLLGVIRSTVFTTWSASALMDIQPLDAEDLLEALVEAQLVEVSSQDDRADGMVRYRFHDLVRLYAQERLEAEESAQERESATVRLLDAFVLYGCRANAAIERWPEDPWSPPTGTPPVWSDQSTIMTVDSDPAGWLSRERDGMVHAVRQAHEAERWDHTWNLAAALATILEWEADWQNWQTVLELSRDAAERGGDPRRRAIALYRLARFAWDRDDWVPAASLFDECSAAVAELADARLTAIVERGRGELWRDQGRWQRAIEAYERSLEHFRAVGERHWTARVIGNLGDVHRDQGRWTEALACYEECLADFESLDDSRSVAITTRSMGDVYRDQGSLPQAISCYGRCLPTFRAIGDVRWQAFTLRARAVAHAHHGDRDAALSDAEEALAIFRQVADRRGEAIVLQIIGDVHAGDGEWAEALDLYQVSVAILAELGDTRTEAMTRRCIARGHHHLRDWDAARSEYGRSLEMLRALGDVRALAQVEEDLAMLRADEERESASRPGTPPA